MYYALWDLRLGNQLATFRVEDEALEAVYQMIQVMPPPLLNELSLDREHEDGEIEIVADGPELLRLAIERHRVPA